LSYIDIERAQKLAQFVPLNERVKLLNLVIDACGGNISKTAKEIGITRAQIYRYIGRTERKDLPSDEIFARIIVAAYRLRPLQTQEFFRFILKQVRDLFSRI